MPQLLPKFVLRPYHAFWSCLLLIQALITPPPAQAQVDVLTQRYDNSRSGCNLAEQTLNPSAVNPKRFGKLFSREVDGEIYAQPLVVSSLTMPKQGKRNVVFVATEHNSVYAFDATDPLSERPFWHINLGNPIPTQDLGSACGVYSDFSREVGITGTPVIDAKTQTLYVVARTKDPVILGATPSPSPVTPRPNTAQLTLTEAEASGPAPGTPSTGEQAIASPSPAPDIANSKGYRQYLHAVDLTTGKERPHSPVEICASVRGTGAGSVKGVLAFNPRLHNQRAALVLHDGLVTICWAGHCDTGPYHGWLMSYDAHTLQQKAVFCTTPNGIGAGIWQSGGGPSVDEAGNIYLVTGNGSVDTDRPLQRHTEYGSTLLRLSIKGGQVQVADWFTPYNYTSLNESDLDTGSTSVVLLPGTNLIAAGSKAGILYVLDRRKLGGFDELSDQQIVQKLAVSPGFLYSTPLLWKRTGHLPWLYSWGMDDRLKAFELRDNQLVPVSASPAGSKITSSPAQTQPAAFTFNPLPVSQSAPTISAPRPGGILSLSSNGNTPNSAVLWSLQSQGDAIHAVAPGVLRAFDANDLNHELWNSNLNAPRDGVGLFAKFCPPVVANGKVYVASFSNQLNVYGLNPSLQVAAPVISSRSGTIKDFVTIDSEEPRAIIRYTLDGTTPTTASPRYRTPFLADRVALVKARAFVKGQLPSPLVTALVSDPDPQAPGSGLLGNYFGNKDLSGEPLLQVESEINNQRVPSGILSNDWSARWTGDVQAPESGTYTFTTNSDDGVRLWVNNQLLIDDWKNHFAQEDSATITLEKGKHYPLTMEYFQADQGAAYQLMWTPPGLEKTVVPRSQLHAGLGLDLNSSGTGDGLLASYFATLNLRGKPIQRVDATVDNNAIPAGLPTTNWSTRWSGELEVPQTGSYTLTTESDDGVRLRIGSKLVINNWTNHFVTPDSVTLTLEKGKRYPLVMEYYQVDQAASYRLLWTPPGGKQTIIPHNWLYSTQATPPPTVIGQGKGLTGFYFKNSQLQGQALTRQNDQVGVEARPDSIPATGWSARWQGEVQATRSGTFTFSTVSDDGVRLWLGEQLLIDDWNVHGDTKNSVTIELVAGQRYPLCLDYFQSENGSSCQLLWTPPDEEETAVPSTQLYPVTARNAAQAPQLAARFLKPGDKIPSDNIPQDGTTPDTGANDQ